ncbi:hypothetical protein KPC83_03135 [Collinsella sp. zg1085]|uniref:hypothetical protein n=1 Tax=Collinsella sp. zg1085 TaxID=2844380 RepID=UPI001C0D1B28|nr:hypothetical protein [Collinsella sp. zg1085]QWT18137.1 hypothetical protein KPC83_03135 [Collinsella sp. zg1085]
MAISLRDSTRTLGPVEIFIPFNELVGIYTKVSKTGFEGLDSIVSNRGMYRFSQTVYDEKPDEMKKISDSRILSSSFDRFPSFFTSEKPEDEHEYIQIFGLSHGKRQYRWLRKDYLAKNNNLNKWKVMVPKANGSGALGEVLSTPLIGQPLIGHTETFISIGSFDSEYEAEALLKYIKSKFARALLGVLKVTQDNTRPVWRYVPLQDFTSASDIDWSKSISEIDTQLYAKYGLTPEEIAFIETNVKEME